MLWKTYKPGIYEISIPKGNILTSNIKVLKITFQDLIFQHAVDFWLTLTNVENKIVHSHAVAAIRKNVISTFETSNMNQIVN